MATPIRSCPLSQLTLPEYFHLDFGLQSHPITGALWHLPRLAMRKKTKPSDEGQPVGDTSAATNANHQDSTHPSTAQPRAEGPKHLRTLSGSYLPARAPALRYISGMRHKHYLRVIIPYRWKGDLALNANHIVWREDMEQYVLSLMRTEIISSLSYLSSLPAGYIVRCNDWASIDQHRQVAAVLWLGDVTPQKDSSNAGPGEADTDWQSHTSMKEKEPPPYAMVFYRGQHIPVYNLRSLLSPSCLSTLAQNCVPLRGTLTLIKRKHNTVDLQLALWKLMGYLAPDD